LTSLPLILAAVTAATPLPFAGGPPWDATYTEMGEALTVAGWEVRGDGETLFACSGTLELTLRWDEDGFMTGVTFVERRADEADALETFTARRSALSVTYGEPLKTEDRYVFWEAAGYDVVLELDEIHSVEGRSPVVLIRYERHEP
jgi:hypothetical protein